MIAETKYIHAPQITSIHISELRGDFLPSLGFNFLQSVYQGVIGRKRIWSFIYIEKGEVGGFIIGTSDMGYFFKEAMRENFLKLAFFLLIKLILNPFLIKNVLETFLYPKKEIGPKAELVVIAVMKKFQGKGIGKKLMLKLEEVFQENKVKNYKVTVHQDKKANSFYEYLNFKRVGEFSLYGKIWYTYEKTIS